MKQATEDANAATNDIATQHLRGFNEEGLARFPRINTLIAFNVVWISIDHILFCWLPFLSPSQPSIPGTSLKKFVVSWAVISSETFWKSPLQGFLESPRPNLFIDIKISPQICKEAAHQNIRRNQNVGKMSSRYNIRRGSVRQCLSGKCLSDNSPSGKCPSGISPRFESIHFLSFFCFCIFCSWAQNSKKWD